MLTEIENTRQVEGEGRRRWFRDNEFDLIVWYDASDNMIGFQLCYDKSTRERVLTWNAPNRYFHNAIDDGEVAGKAKMTPILVMDGVFDVDRVAADFQARSENLPVQLSEIVLRKIQDYSRR